MLIWGFDIERNFYDLSLVWTSGKWYASMCLTAREDRCCIILNNTNLASVGSLLLVCSQCEEGTIGVRYGGAISWNRGQQFIPYMKNEM